MSDFVNNPQSAAQYIRQKFIDQLPQKIKQIEKLIEQLAENPESENVWVDLREILHKLKGSGGTFGLLTLSEASKEMEALLLEAIHHGDFSGTKKKELEKPFQKLQGICQEIFGSHLAHMPDLISVPSPEQIPIFLLEEDPQLMEDLSSQLSCFGYEVKTFQTFQSLWDSAKKNKSGVLLLDALHTDWAKGQKHISSLKTLLPESMPIIFLSTRDDLQARLEAVRFGGDAYFVKPIDVLSLVDRLDQLTLRSQGDPFRVLIMDDNQEESTYYALVLKEAGLSSLAVNDPFEIMKPMTQFRPDLILMDLNMPGLHGTELVSLIRQNDSFLGIPIIYLSAESNHDKQAAAMLKGGDGFLSKPVSANQLVSSIISWARRSRILRRQLVKDGLTGLFNHNYFISLLEGEVERARRYASSFALFMMDIDQFKMVNDTYGHPVGDRVIKKLARILQQRLRRNDIISRYGGEEFAVVLIHVEEQQALRVCNEIRETFSNVVYEVKDKKFHVTLSGGISIFPRWTKPSALIEAADQALYQAKKQGGNQVVLAGC